MIGERFGRLVVLNEVERNVHGKRQCLVRCDCGVEKLVNLNSLLDEATSSCGCLNREIVSKQFSVHGHAKANSVEYRAWKNMKARCTTNRKNPLYKLYYGRGIRVCEAWHQSFEAFLNHIGVRPNEALTVDRIDNDKGYEPGNVRWADRKTQAANSRKRGIT